jgi:hypothetical protein
MCYFWHYTPAELDALDDDTIAAFKEFMQLQARQQAKGR